MHSILWKRRNQLWESLQPPVPYVWKIKGRILTGFSDLDLLLESLPRHLVQDEVLILGRSLGDRNVGDRQWLWTSLPKRDCLHPLPWVGPASAYSRIHRCGAALGLEQGVRAVGRDGPRSIPINGAGGGLWLSLGAPMAVLGSGAGAGSAGQHAGEDNRGPGRCDSVGRLGSLVDVSGAVGAVRQAMAGLAIEPARE